MKQLDVIAAVLVVVGALNWGLVCCRSFRSRRRPLRHAVRRSLAAQRRRVRTSRSGRGVSGAVLEARAEPLGAYRSTRARSLTVSISTQGVINVEENGNWNHGRARTHLHHAFGRTGADQGHRRYGGRGRIVQDARAALTAADLVNTLKGAGPFTVFAPTDEAFAKLPAGTVETLLKPENKAKLQRILTYHVVAGKVMAADVMKMKSAKAVSGDSLTIAVRDGDVMADNRTSSRPTSPRATASFTSSTRS